MQPRKKPIPKNAFQLSNIIPEYPPGSDRHVLLTKQKEILDWINSGILTGGGCVYQGGKGSGKTIIGAIALIWAHHQPKWKGLTSFIGRETYPSLVTSTADEFFQMIAKLPRQMVKSATKPSKNSMGWVEWAVGGRTMLCSLSNSDTWESANIGLVWVDEGHRQNERIIGDLETRLRQPSSPRCMIITTNPGGKGWMWKLANPESDEYRPTWRWLEASSMENPALPPDYKQRLIDKYGQDTPAYKRWVLGSSAALEGTVFTEFNEEPTDCIHVVPAVDLPREWSWGRALDYGMVNPTSVIWGARDPMNNLWIDHMHYAPEKPDDRDKWDVARHSEVILDYDSLYPDLDYVPADPSIFAKNKESRDTGVQFSTADQFYDCGVELTRADNDREGGLQELLDLFRVDMSKTHPVSLKLGTPRIFILDRPEMDPLIRELLNLLWAKPDGTVEKGRPDDCQKKNDHAYDALRYLAKADPIHSTRQDDVRSVEDRQVLGSGGRRRSY